MEKAGCQVEFPSDQGCCGQPAYNIGLVEDARVMAAQTLDVLDATAGPVIVPSGSCAAMIRNHYPHLFPEGESSEQAERVGSRVRELTEFLVDDLQSDLTAGCDGCSVAYHYSCHGLRDLGLSTQADQLLESVDRVTLEDDTECCGFGGIFSIEMPAVSTAIMNDKLDKIISSGADTVVGGDVPCLIHIGGGLRRRGVEVEVRHIAELLGEA